MLKCLEVGLSSLSTFSLLLARFLGLTAGEGKVAEAEAEVEGGVVLVECLNRARWAVKEEDEGPPIPAAAGGEEEQEAAEEDMTRR